MRRLPSASFHSEASSGRLPCSMICGRVAPSGCSPHPASTVPVPHDAALGTVDMGIEIERRAADETLSRSPRPHCRVDPPSARSQKQQPIVKRLVHRLHRLFWFGCRVPFNHQNRIGVHRSIHISKRAGSISARMTQLAAGSALRRTPTCTSRRADLIHFVGDAGERSSR